MNEQIRNIINKIGKWDISPEEREILRNYKEEPSCPFKVGDVLMRLRGWECFIADEELLGDKEREYELYYKFVTDKDIIYNNEIVRRHITEIEKSMLKLKEELKLLKEDIIEI